MGNTIESLENTKIKEIRSLNKKKYRTKLKKYLIEGTRIVEEALLHGVRIEKIILLENYPLHEKLKNPAYLHRLKEIEVLSVTEKVFKSISNTESPQGIIAVIHKEEETLENNRDKISRDPFILILENIQDPGNMGTIIRTAEAAGVDLILVTKNSTDPYGEKALRSSMGAIFHIPIVEVEDLEWVNLFKKEKIRLIATDLSAEKSYSEIDYRGGIGLIIGNEGQGISNELLKLADEKTIIPIHGNIESLNASIASGILIYKAQEKRR